LPAFLRFFRRCDALDFSWATKGLVEKLSATEIGQGREREWWDREKEKEDRCGGYSFLLTSPHCIAVRV